MKTGLLLIAAFLVGLGGAYFGFKFSIFNFQFSNKIQQAILVKQKATPTSNTDTITIMAVGDVMLSRSVLEQMLERHDYAWPFASTAATLRAADLTVGNLETPVNQHCPPMTNRMVFCAPQEVMAGLTSAGFDFLSLENNHSLNTGVQGKETTAEILKQTGITGMRQDALAIKTVRGVNIGFLAFDDVSQRLDEALVMQEVASAAAQVDVLIGLVHWGVEYTPVATERQQDLGHQLVDAGMKVVIGAHPHWTQPVEPYHGGLIFYSLGNFVFDQMWSEKTQKGEIAFLQFEIRNSKFENMKYHLIPIKIYNYGQPRIER